jgi:metallo-beta-lactamase family protein
MVTIHKEQVPVRARIESIDSLSGHADYGEILRWLAGFPKPPQKVWMVHGEPAGAQSLRDKIAAQANWQAEVAQYLQKITL